jgi:hypothetical protein
LDKNKPGQSAKTERKGDKNMKKYELIKGCFLGLMVAALVLLGSLPASALCVNYYFTEAGTLVVDQGGAFYDSVTGDPVCYNPTPKHTVVRPLSDFLDVQGTFCFPDGTGGCLIFNPGIPNFLTWRDVSRNRRAAVDYAGFLGEFGTVVTGTVSETELKDGRAFARINFDTTNAFSWVVDGNNTATSPVILGNRLDAVQAGAEPALGNSLFRIEFFTSGMGAPLPDLIQLLAFPGAGSSSLRSFTFTADIMGELHEAFGVAEGTPGEATITMLNLQMNGPGPTIPVDNIMVEVAQ